MGRCGNLSHCQIISSGGSGKTQQMPWRKKKKHQRFLFKQVNFQCENFMYCLILGVFS